MTKCFLKYVITGTSEHPIESMEKFDPLLLKEINLILLSMLGGQCKVEVDTIELVAAESIDYCI